MCGRFTLRAAATELAARFQAPPPDVLPRFNIAPTQTVLAVRQPKADREFARLRWGLIPAWAKDARGGYRMINARAETVADKPAFRAAFRQRRCLIPADGFYEWQVGPGGKQPYYFSLTDGGVFAFAGLWERWRGPDGDPIESCALIVTVANSVTQPIHDRMPVILAPADYAAWLDPDRRDAASLGALLRPYPAERMRAYPVSARMNKPSYDQPDCIEPLASA